MKNKFITLLGKATSVKVMITMFALLLFTLLTSARATTYYVDKDCTHGCILNNGSCSYSNYCGTSWDTACCNIGKAISLAQEGSTIMVAPPAGICSITSTTTCTDDADCPQGETCIGKCSLTTTTSCNNDADCPGGETCILREYNETLNIDKNGITLKSEAGPKNTIIFSRCCQNFWYPVIGVSAPDVTIDGFTITMKYPPQDFLCSEMACGDFQDCWIPSRLIEGSGIFAHPVSNLTVNNCIIRNNFGQGAGGIFCDGCTLTVINSKIVENDGGDFSGAIQMRADSQSLSSIKLINTLISDNVGCASGGIWARKKRDDFLIPKNSLSLLNSTITNNVGHCCGSTHTGCCGISMAYTDLLTMENSIVWWNGNEKSSFKQFAISDATGNDVYQYDQSYLYMQGTNRVCSVTTWTACVNDADCPVGETCIPNGPYQYNMHFPNRFNINITNSNIQTTNFIDYRLFRTQDTTNINLDPEFKDMRLPSCPDTPRNNDYRLDGSSPCIDKGNNDALDLPDKDVDGNPRITDGDENGSVIVDIGAYESEFDPNSLVANFEVDPPAGTLKINPFGRTQVLEPLRVQFTDTSIDPTHNHTCHWDFGDCCEISEDGFTCIKNCTSDDCNPSHEYWGPVDNQILDTGMKDYIVTLTVSDGVNSDTRTVNYAVHLTDLPSIIQIESTVDEHGFSIIGYDFDDNMLTEFGEKIYHPGDQTHLCDLYSFYWPWTVYYPLCNPLPLRNAPSLSAM
jgi:hypothetical protein